MTEPDDTQRLLAELADYITQVIGAVSQAGEAAPELPEVTDAELKRILARHLINDHGLEEVRRSWSAFQAGALGWGRASELAQQRYRGEW